MPANEKVHATAPQVFTCPAVSDFVERVIVSNWNPDISNHFLQAVHDLALGPCQFRVTDPGSEGDARGTSSA